MEILSQMVKGTDSGVGFSQQRAGPQMRDNSRFARVVEEALARKSLLPVKELNQESTIPRHRFPGLLSKSEEDPDENLAVGVIGNQLLVVSILEGDKESATDPEMLIGSVGSVNTDHTPDITHMMDVETVEINTEANIAQIKQTDANEVQNTANNNNDTTGADVQGANADSGFAASDGEVTARMPSARTSEQSEKMEVHSKSTDNGNLSPLENENETAQIKEKPKSSSSDMTQTDSRSAEDAEQPQNNVTVPLAEGIRPERFRADQQIRQIAPDAPVRAENLFDEMISRIDSMKTDTMHSMTIQLKPEFLGKVALELMVDAAGVHLKIDAANGDVRAMINGQINALIESLEQKGIEVVEVEVTHTGIDNGAFKQSSGGQAQSSNPKHRYRGVNPSDRVEYYAALPVDVWEYYLDAGVSSVEYSA